MANKYKEQSKAKEKREEFFASKKRKDAANIKFNMDYIKRSHSQGAEDAYRQHKKPYEKWDTINFRNEAWRILREEGYDIVDISIINDRMSDLGKYKLRKMLLCYSREKHHVGKNYELVAFFEVDKNKLLAFADAEIRKCCKVSSEKNDAPADND